MLCFLIACVPCNDLATRPGFTHHTANKPLVSLTTVNISEQHQSVWWWRVFVVFHHKHLSKTLMTKYKCVHSQMQFYKIAIRRTWSVKQKPMQTQGKSSEATISVEEPDCFMTLEKDNALQWPHHLFWKEHYSLLFKEFFNQCTTFSRF